MRGLTLIVAAIAFVGGLAGASASAETTDRFRILVTSANVRSSPEATSGVVAIVPRHVTLELLGEVDDGWLRVAVFDSSGRKQVGYVKASLGRREMAIVEAPAPTAPLPVPQTEAARPSAPAAVSTFDAAPASVPGPAGASTSAAGAPALMAQQRPNPLVTATPPTPSVPRRFALGGRVGGSSFGVGGTVRYWVTPALGIDVLVSRYSVGISDYAYAGITAEASASVLQIAPAVTYRFGEQDPDDDVSVRPYVGGGVSLFRSSFKASAQGYGLRTEESASSSDMGFRGFGGVELFFKSMPRLSVTSDIGYYSVGAPFTGISIGGLAVGIGANWYLN